MQWDEINNVCSHKNCSMVGKKTLVIQTTTALLRGPKTVSALSYLEKHLRPIKTTHTEVSQLALKPFLLAPGPSQLALRPPSCFSGPLSFLRGPPSSLRGFPTLLGGPYQFDPRRSQLRGPQSKKWRIFRHGCSRGRRRHGSSAFTDDAVTYNNMSCQK